MCTFGVLGLSCDAQRPQGRLKPLVCAHCVSRPHGFPTTQTSRSRRRRAGINLREYTSTDVDVYNKVATKTCSHTMFIVRQTNALSSRRWALLSNLSKSALSPVCTRGLCLTTMHQAGVRQVARHGFLSFDDLRLLGCCEHVSRTCFLQVVVTQSCTTVDKGNTTRALRRCRSKFFRALFFVTQCSRRAMSRSTSRREGTSGGCTCPRCPRRPESAQEPAEHARTTLNVYKKVAVKATSQTVFIVRQTNVLRNRRWALVNDPPKPGAQSLRAWTVSVDTMPAPDLAQW